MGDGAQNLIGIDHQSWSRGGGYAARRLGEGQRQKRPARRCNKGEQADTRPQATREMSHGILSFCNHCMYFIASNERLTAMRRRASYICNNYILVFLLSLYYQMNRKIRQTAYALSPDTPRMVTAPSLPRTILRPERGPLQRAIFPGGTGSFLIPKQWMKEHQRARYLFYGNYGIISGFRRFDALVRLC